MSDQYVSFYFDISTSPVIYGVTVWSGSFTSENRSLSVQINLTTIDSGVVNLSNLAEFVFNYSNDRIRRGLNDRIILDKTPEMIVLVEELKKNYSFYSIELVERSTTITEQIAKYSMMFNRNRFFTGEFLVESDLIFDDVAIQNLIDPIYTDEQIVFPMTQALLVGCHYLETHYRFHPGSMVGGKLLKKICF